MLRAEAVWDRLNRLNMTQNELAGLLGISSGHLSRLVNGRRCPSPSMRRGLMEALGCSEFDELFVAVNRERHLRPHVFEAGEQLCDIGIVHPPPPDFQ